MCIDYTGLNKLCPKDPFVFAFGVRVGIYKGICGYVLDTESAGQASCWRLGLAGRLWIRSAVKILRLRLLVCSGRWD